MNSFTKFPFKSSCIMSMDVMTLRFFLFLQGDGKVILSYLYFQISKYCNVQCRQFINYMYFKRVDKVYNSLSKQNVAKSLYQIIQGVCNERKELYTQSTLFKIYIINNQLLQYFCLNNLAFTTARIILYLFIYLLNSQITYIIIALFNIL